MNELPYIKNEEAVANAFNRQAPLFDGLYAENTIVHYKRERVRNHVLRYLQPNSSILELNAGTGDDAVFFASLGHSVHATDISESMLGRLKKKVDSHDLREYITQELRSYTDLKNLFNKGPYDLVFSNFAGLNCTDQLKEVLFSLSPLLKPGGIVTLIILPKFCLWEFLLLFKGHFKTAFRRFAGRKGAKAHIEGQFFRCWYYNPSFVIRAMRGSFELLDHEGLCTLVPPSYIEGFAEKHPGTYQFLKKKEEKWKSVWPWKNTGDYYIISFRKKSGMK